MGRPRGGGKTWRPKLSPPPAPLTAMSDRHHAIVRMATLGYKNTEIAQKLGITPESVGQVRRSPIAKLKTGEIQDRLYEEAFDAAKEIQATLPAAIKIMQRIVNDGELREGDEWCSTDRGHQLQAAKDLLGMNGFAPIKKVESKSISAHLSGEDIDRLVQDAIDAGMEQGQIYIEGEVVEESEQTDED